MSEERGKYQAGENIGPNLTSLLNMQLHAHIQIEGWRITRVPGGWLYENTIEDLGHPVFVPLPQEGRA